MLILLILPFDVKFDLYLTFDPSTVGRTKRSHGDFACLPKAYMLASIVLLFEAV